MEFTKNAISWFEVPVVDFQRAKSFYSKIFDFEMPEMMMGPVTMGFFLYDQENGGIGGAIVKGEGLEPSNTGSRVYLNGGEDLQVVLDRVVAAGGRIVDPKTFIAPGMGYWGGFEDTEGNFVYLHSPN